MVKLIIAEKDSVARRISQILSDNKAKSTSPNGVRVYRWDDCICVGLRGHIVQLDFPREYNSWSAVAPEALISTEPEYVVTEKKVVEALKKLGDEADEIVVATDFDREGELIGKEAVDLLITKKPVRRVRFSSLVEDEIKDAFSRPTDIDENLVDAARARQWIDLIWGAVLTRLISMASKSVGKNFLSVGRVQTPTLAKVVEQDRKIAEFVPKKYWRIVCTFSKDGESFKATHENVWDESEARSIFDRVRSASEGEVTEFAKRSVSKRRPAPFDTTEFLRCTNYIHVTPARAMSMAEDLYAHGYISYPRTDNTVYPRGLDLKGIVGKLSGIREFREVSEFLIKEGIRPSRGRVESKDHPPIYPTGIIPAKRDAVYDLIARRFLATLHRDAEVERKDTTIMVEGENFSADGQRLTYDGYLQIWTYERFEERRIPDLEKGERVKLEKAELVEDETKPQARMQLGSLIALMEKLGLGTKSTRAEIVQKLYDREYVRGNPPVSTEIAVSLVGALDRYADKITEVEMTQKLEEDMELIAAGKKTFKEVVEESRELLREITGIIEEHRTEIGAEILKAVQSNNSAGRCPKCGGELRVLVSKKKKRFVACKNYPNCRNTYPLPQKGNIRFEGACEKCGAPILVFYAGRRRVKGCANPECEKTAFKYGKKQEKQIAPEARSD
jgi:DNA topoisomerase-1